MAYTTIDDPSAFFQTALYTGNSGTLAVTNDGNSDLQPDLVWTKKRSDTSHNTLVDSSRGATKQIYSNLTAAEETVSGVTAFNTDGFTLGSNGTANLNGATFVGWQWKANGGTTSSNTDGDINSTVQVNSDAGFSIVTYTGNFTATQTVGHGLGVRPNLVIIKNRDTAVDWVVWTSELTSGNFLKLNSDAAQSSSSRIYQNGYTTSTFGIGANNTVNKSGDDLVAYCFAEKQGYSKFGSYIGNGSGTSDGTFNGPFVYLGFKPAWVLIKRSSYSAGDGWTLFDNKRGPINYNQNKLNPASTAAESGAVYDAVDFLSNGFKIRTGRAGANASGSTYIYMAFAENPFVTSTGVPATAY